MKGDKNMAVYTNKKGDIAVVSKYDFRTQSISNDYIIKSSVTRRI